MQPSSVFLHYNGNPPPLRLVLLDVDGFRREVQTYGHQQD